MFTAKMARIIVAAASPYKLTPVPGSSDSFNKMLCKPTGCRYCKKNSVRNDTTKK
jgi:hypothetical protein